MRASSSTPRTTQFRTSVNFKVTWFTSLCAPLIALPNTVSLAQSTGSSTIIAAAQTISTQPLTWRILASVTHSLVVCISCRPHLALTCKSTLTVSCRQILTSCKRCPVLTPLGCKNLVPALALKFNSNCRHLQMIILLMLLYLSSVWTLSNCVIGTKSFKLSKASLPTTSCRECKKHAQFLKSIMISLNQQLKVLLLLLKASWPVWTRTSHLNNKCLSTTRFSSVSPLILLYTLAIWPQPNLLLRSRRLTMTSHHWISFKTAMLRTYTI